MNGIDEIQARVDDEKVWSDYYQHTPRGHYMAYRAGDPPMNDQTRRELAEAIAAYVAQYQWGRPITYPERKPTMIITTQEEMDAAIADESIVYDTHRIEVHSDVWEHQDKWWRPTYAGPADPTMLRAWLQTTYMHTAPATTFRKGIVNE